MDELLMLSNSPGEVSGWVMPVAAAFAKLNAGARVTLTTLPCQYASGLEASCARGMEGIDEAGSFRSVWKHPAGGGRTLVLQLGGDPMFGALLKARTRGGWMIYTSRPRWRSLVDRFFLPDERAASRFEAKGVARRKYAVVGNLILDSVPAGAAQAEARSLLGLDQDGAVVSFLVGSRPFEYLAGLPFFIRAAQLLAASFANFTALLPLAPTADEALMRGCMSRAGLKWRGADSFEEIVWEGQGRSRIRFVRGHTFEAIGASDLAIALPGTNNLQIAALGVPLLMVAPLNEAENIPLDGLAGSMPLPPRLKKRLVLWYNDREKYLSLPNRLTGADIVPEHRCIMTPETVARLAAGLLSSPRKLDEIREGYKKVPLAKGAAARIAAAAADFFKEKV